MIMTETPILTVLPIGMVPGGIMPASIHTSMVPIIITHLLVMLMALFGTTGKVGIILSSSQR